MASAVLHCRTKEKTEQKKNKGKVEENGRNKRDTTPKERNETLVLTCSVTLSTAVGLR